MLGLPGEFGGPKLGRRIALSGAFDRAERQGLIIDVSIPTAPILRAKSAQ